MGHVVFEPELVNLGDIIDNNFKLFAPNALAKDIKLKAEKQPTMTAFTNAHMVETILRNLINNAIKYTPEHGCITVNAHKNAKTIEVSISDNGVGIAQNKIRNLFQLGEKSSTLGTKGETGTGLGLHLCEELIKKQGGEIMVESVEGKGSTFRFTLPQQSSVL